MKYQLTAVVFALASGLAWAARATPFPLGFISCDITVAGSLGHFDITNETGLNTSPPTFPVSTEVQFNTLSLAST